MSQLVVTRCTVLFMSVILAMPVVNGGFDVRGGDVKSCDTTKLDGIDCKNKGELTDCDEEKQQCVGCGEGRKGSLCETGASPACGGDPQDCADGQTNADNDDTDCIAQDC